MNTFCNRLILPGLSLKTGHKTSLARILRRNYFSNTYLNLDVTMASINQERLLVSDPVSLKKSVQANFDKNGIKNIFSEDIVKLLALSDSPNDLDLALELLKASVQEDLRFVDFSGDLQSYVTRYFEVCHIQNLPEDATRAWNDPDLKSTSILLNTRGISKLYFNLLFKNGQYTDIIDIFEASRPNDRDVTTLTLLACYKVGTEQSLKKGLDILAEARRAKMGERLFYVRGQMAISWLAYCLQEYRLAYDLIVRLESNTRSLVLQTIKLMVLSDSGRLREAVTYLRTDYLGRLSRRRRCTVCYCAISNLMERVRESDDKELFQELMEVIKMLDNVAVVVNDTVDDLLMETKLSDKEFKKMMKKHRLREKSGKSKETLEPDYEELE